MGKGLRVKYASATPPGGAWAYFDEALGRMFETYGMLDDLHVQVRSAYAVNGREPPEDLEDKVLEYVCARAPEGFCIGGDPDASRPRRMLTISSIRNFTTTLTTLVSAAARGEKIYNDDPNAAAEVCVGCPLNKKQYCSSCTGLESVARLLLRQKQTTPYDSQLGACEACGCMLRVKVHYSPEVLRRAVLKADEPRYPKEHCWIWQEENNDAD